jgi:glutamyl-tRNA synthetase
VKKIKTRFAPSPTGGLHIGGLRTALYSYLFAKKNGGEFLLRIEDTDSKRFVPGAEEYIIASLSWMGLVNDGKILKQSERKDIYKAYAEKLIKSEHAYYAFDTPEELESKKLAFASAGVSSPQYNHVMRQSMKNSLVLSKDDVNKRMESGDPYVIRIKMSRKEEIRFKDKVKGWIVTSTDTLDDKVIWKSSDGLPTYHLANVVDDFHSGITHVIRGVEWLPSTPLHVHLYKSLGWSEDTPEFVHLPLLTYNGKKLSKRNADQYGIPVYALPWEEPGGTLDVAINITKKVSDNFQGRGFSPEALINFLSLLGWNPGTEQEIFTIDELINSFSLERIGNASGAEVDMKKAEWINAQHLRRLPVNVLSAMCERDDIFKGFSIDYRYKAIGMIQERCVFPKDVLTEVKFFFVAPESYNDDVIKKSWKSSHKSVLEEIRNGLSKDEEFSVESTEATTKRVLDEIGLVFKNIFPILRTLLVGDNKGPKMFDIISHLGKKETLLRLDVGIEYVSHLNNEMVASNDKG